MSSLSDAQRRLSGLPEVVRIEPVWIEVTISTNAEMRNSSQDRNTQPSNPAISNDPWMWAELSFKRAFIAVFSVLIDKPLVKPGDLSREGLATSGEGAK